MLLGNDPLWDGRLDKLTAAAKVIYLHYAAWADSTGHTYRRTETVAAATGYSTRQVRRALAELVTAGCLIHDGNGPGRPDVAPIRYKVTGLAARRRRNS